MNYTPEEVVLKCGCVTSSFGAIKVLGEGHEIQACDRHDGWFRILRKASNNERFQFYILGTPVSARTAKRTLGQLLEMSAVDSEHETKGTRPAQSALF